MTKSIIDAMEGITFGCDPELFIINGDEEFICADGIIPGTKQNPHPVEKGAVQVDGMAAEFNIDPVTNFKDFSDNVKTVLRQLKEFLPPGHKLVTVPSVEFSQKVWDSAPTHAKALGCSPDFNAWTGQVNPPPEDLTKPRLRTASGHLHIGWTDDADMSDLQHILTCRDLIKQLDWYLGPWSVRIDRDKERRRLYGKAGAMRFKPYGVEYRVLSNFWLANPNRMIGMWNRMQQAIWDMKSYQIADMFSDYNFNNLLVEGIDTSTRVKNLEQNFRFPVMTLDKEKRSWG